MFQKTKTKQPSIITNLTSAEIEKKIHKLQDEIENV
jgi:hypothetical protein